MFDPGDLFCGQSTTGLSGTLADVHLSVNTTRIKADGEVTELERKPAASCPSTFTFQRSRSTNAHPDKALVEDSYDAIAPKYLAWSAPRPTDTRKFYIDRLAASLPARASVLELGCGGGVPATQLLLQHGLTVTGTDISQAQINLAKEHCPEGTFVKGDMNELDFAPDSFDAVCSFYAIWHLPVEEQAQVITKMKTWVKKGGKLLFNLRTDEGEHRWPDWMGAPMYSCGVGVEGNRTMVAQDGFKVEEEIAVEKVGRFEEKMHWFYVTRA